MHIWRQSKENCQIKGKDRTPTCCPLLSKVDARKVNRLQLIRLLHRKIQWESLSNKGCYQDYGFFSANWHWDSTAKDSAWQLIGHREVELMHIETIHPLHAWFCGAAECSAATEEIWTWTSCTELLKSNDILPSRYISAMMT